MAASTPWQGLDILSTKQFTRADIESLFEVAAVMQRIVDTRGGCNLLQHRVLANVFYEPSTRTSCSFATAMARLGGAVLQINESSSSAAKGETLADTMRCLECYADAIVLRHPILGSAAAAAAACSKPVLNAGDGIGEHPTQALLDLFTIQAERGRIDGTHVVLVGDLKHGRTVHSLAKILSVFSGIRLSCVAPSSLAMPADLVAELAALGMGVAEVETLTPEILAAADVLYVTRVQKERFASLADYERLKHAYVIGRESMSHLATAAIIMHPLPRVGEIKEEVDADPRAAYFRQMRYGLFVRMALLALVMGVTSEAVTAEASSLHPVKPCSSAFDAAPVAAGASCAP